MMDYLLNYLSEEDYKVVKFNISNLDKYNFSNYEDNICEVLDYLKFIGVTNFKDLLLYRCDVCYKDVDRLKEMISNYDLNLIVDIFNQDVSALINFDI